MAEGRAPEREEDGMVREEAEGFHGGGGGAGGFFLGRV